MIKTSLGVDNFSYLFQLFEEQIQRQNETKSNNGVTTTTTFAAAPPPASKENNKENHHQHIIDPKMEKKEEETPPTSTILSKNIFVAAAAAAHEEKPKIENIKRPAAASSKKPFVRVSKFKHLKGDPILKGKFENLKNLSKTVPAESGPIKANKDRIAVPISGPGGKLAIFETRKPGRIPDGVLPVLINGTTVLDFAFDPFDNRRIACACDDGIIRVWTVPETGLASQVNEPQLDFAAHGEKIQIVKWHPLANDILLTAGFDRKMKIWDLNHVENGAQIELEV